MNYGHIFKMDSNDEFIPDISSKDHRKVTYSELKKKTYGKRLCLEDYIKDFEELKNPYWVVEQSGHLPDRVIALNHSIIDMLKMGDYPMSFYLQDKKSKEYLSDDLSKQSIKGLSLSPNFSARQIALTFFIVSHYVSDCHMPLHCDFRDYKADKVEGGSERRLPKPLHSGIEEVWEGYFPEKADLTIHDYTPESIDSVVSKLPDGSIIEIDNAGSSYSLSTYLPSTMPNEWDEMVNIARISYAVSRKWIPHEFKDIVNILGTDKCRARASPFKYNDVTKIIDPSYFKDVTNRIFHDAVESVARLWYRAWNIFCK